MLSPVAIRYIFVIVNHNGNKTADIFYSNSATTHVASNTKFNRRPQPPRVEACRRSAGSSLRGGCRHEKSGLGYRLDKAGFNSQEAKASMLSCLKTN